MLKRLALVLPLLWCAEASARGATLPAGFTEVSYGGISGGTAMAVAPDGRIFVCEQGGKLRVIKNGAFLATPFLTLTVDSNGERGLLGIAFDPNFVTNQYVYVYYTVPTAPIHNRLSRFTANGDVAVAGSEFVLLNLDNLTATNHNGGALHFGLDGKLYVAVGENAVASNAQTLTNLLGKILRLNSDGSIPADNPFNGNPNARHEIWTYGHRNPFSFGVQPFTGRIFVNDVGQVTTEEIDEEMAGLNYGWPTCEGPFLQGSTTTPCNNPAYTDPFSYYLHTGSPTPCAITGGDFYNPQTPQFPSNYVGNYFFADYCGDFIQRIDPDTQVVTTFATGIGRAGGHRRGRLRQPLLPGAGRGRRLQGDLHGQQRPGDHAESGQPADLVGSSGDVQRRGLGRGAADVPVAEERRGHRRGELLRTTRSRRSGSATTATSTGASSPTRFRRRRRAPRRP